MEAFKIAHVKDAVKDIPTLLLGYGIKVVPLPDMVAAVTPGEGRAADVSVNDWVRMKTGVYKGDLARVVDVEVTAGRATIRLVPRLDLAELARKDRERAEGVKRERQPPAFKGPKVRPPARPFRPEEAKDQGLPVFPKELPALGRVLELPGGAMLQEGYLLKRVSLKTLIREEHPSIEELRRFTASARDEAGEGEEDEVARLAAELPKASVEAQGQQAAQMFDKGDRVVVTSGDLRGVTGLVLAVRGGQVDIKPALEDLGELLPFPAPLLQKYWEAGDLVRVSRGPQEGLVGDVVRVEGASCWVFNLSMQREVEVLARDLVRATAGEQSGRQERFGPYELFDFVVLDQATFGVITHIEKTHCRVLVNGGAPDSPEVRTCTLPDIKRRIAGVDPKGQPGRRDQFAQDMYRSPVGLGDNVTVSKGPGEGRQGQVKFIQRGLLFVQSRDLLENGGFFCVKAIMTRVKGGQQQQQGAGQGGMALRPGQTPLLGHMGGPAAAAMLPPRGGPAGGRGAGGPMLGRRDPMIGKRVEVFRGPHRGLRGTVKDVLDDAYLIEVGASA